MITNPKLSPTVYIHSPLSPVRGTPDDIVHPSANAAGEWTMTCWGEAFGLPPDAAMERAALGRRAG